MDTLEKGQLKEGVLPRDVDYRVCLDRRKLNWYEIAYSMSSKIRYTDEECFA